MNPLTQLSIDAHGGLTRWREIESISAHLIQGGALWPLKNQAGLLDDVSVTVATRRQWASHAPFGDPELRSSFTKDRVAIETAGGHTVEELAQPRHSFAGHTLTTPWNRLQLAFFAGCAMWSYLNLPFALTWPGVESQELPEWTEDGQTWRRLGVHFPEDLEVFSRQQTLYFDRSGLLKRLDYNVEIAGDTPGAHYVSDYQEVSGILFPTRRRIYPRTAEGLRVPEPLVVSIDLDQITLS
jgi:hypothetical protein